MKVAFLSTGKPENSPLFNWLVRYPNTYVHFFADKVTEPPDADVLVSYRHRHKIPARVFEPFGSKAMNLHISLLPYNKGADPVIWSWIDDTPKGVTIHQVSAEYDDGPILVQQRVPLDSRMSLRESYDRLTDAIEHLFKVWWPFLRTGEIVPYVPEPVTNVVRQRTHKPGEWQQVLGNSPAGTKIGEGDYDHVTGEDVMLTAEDAYLPASLDQAYCDI